MTAERVAEDQRRRRALRLDHAGDRGSEVADPRAAAGARGAAVTGQVERQHAVAAHQLRHELDPVRRRAAQAVDEHDRLARAAGEIANRGAADVDEPLDEAGRCSRHPRTVSWVGDEELGDAGPLIPANTTTKR
jgi:hypothetical protein